MLKEDVKKNLNTLTKEFLLKKWNDQKGRCYYSGFNMSHTLNDNLTVSFQKNGIKDNIVLCCWLVNNMKQELSQDEFFSRVKKIYQHKYGNGFYLIFGYAIVILKVAFFWFV